MMPDPSPALEPLDSRMETTLGSTSAATAATVPAGRGWFTEALVVELAGLLLVLNAAGLGPSLPGRVATTTALAPAAPTMRARSAMATTVSADRRLRFAGSHLLASCDWWSVPLLSSLGSVAGPKA